MCIFSHLKTSFKDSRKKKKKSFLENNYISRQFSYREISNFGTDQLRDMGRIQWWVSCVLTIGVQANVACYRWRRWATLSMPVYLVNLRQFYRGQLQWAPINFIKNWLYWIIKYAEHVIRLYIETNGCKAIWWSLYLYALQNYDDCHLNFTIFQTVQSSNLSQSAVPVFHCVLSNPHLLYFYKYSFFPLAVVQWNRLQFSAVMLPTLTQFIIAVRSFDHQIPYKPQTCFY